MSGLDEDIQRAFEEMLPSFSDEMSELSGSLLLLRAHLYIEHAVNFALDKILPNYRVLAKRTQSFGLKIDLLEALGAESDFLAPYRKLNSMRNELAHKLNYSFGEREVREFFSTFQGEQKANLELSLSNHAPAGGGSLTNWDKFKLAIVSLWAAGHALPRRIRND